MDFGNLYGPLQRYLPERLPSTLDLLRQMVAINSFTANAAGVNALGDLTAEAFAELGFRAERIQSVNPDYGRHLVLTRQGSSPQTIGLVSHLDTVFPPEEEIRHDFRWRVKGERIYGPGTEDIKGGTALIYMMLDGLRACAPGLYDQVTWMVLLNASEETLAEDFGELCRKRLAGQGLGCLVFEGGRREGDAYSVVVARKGMAIYDVEVAGRAAHAGSAHAQGANAVVQMGHTIQRIAGLTNYERQLTFNVGTVSGGTVVNRVPHSAHARVEMRTFSPQVFREGVDAMLSLNGQVDVASPADGFPCSVGVRLARQTAPWPCNPGTEDLFRLWVAAGEDLGLAVVPEERGGLSDGNLTWQALPTVDGLGPSGANSHCSERSADGSKDQEYVESDSFVPKALLNIGAVARLAGFSSK